MQIYLLVPFVMIKYKYYRSKNISGADLFACYFLVLIVKIRKKSFDVVYKCFDVVCLDVVYKCKINVSNLLFLWCLFLTIKGWLNGNQGVFLLRDSYEVRQVA